MGWLDNKIEKELKQVLEDEELKEKVNDYVEDIIQEQIKRALRNILIKNKRISS